MKKLENKKIVVITTALVAFGTVFLITGLMMSTVYGAPDFQKNYLTKLDAELNALVDRCSKAHTAEYRYECTSKIEDAWWNDCAFDYDKLDTCKNGIIEEFLKNHGRPT